MLVLAMLGGFVLPCVSFDADVALMPLISLSGFSGLMIAVASSLFLWKMHASDTAFRIVILSATTLLFLLGQALPAVR